jgi:signal transduction histidine kinase
MQAHPLSNPAARITSTSLPASILATQLSTSASPLSAAPPSFAPVLVSDANLIAPAPLLADAAALAHDAGNFLAALGLYCDLLSAPGVLRPEHKHYSTELSLISNRSSALIRRLLGSTIASTSSLPHPNTLLSLSPAHIAPCNTHSYDAAIPSPDHASTLRNLTPVLQRIADGTARVSVTCPHSVPPLNFPTEVIERITVNLVRNAAEAIRIQRSSTYSAALPHCGEIRVSLAVVGPDLQLTVEDNGPGLPPDIAAAFLRPTPLPQRAEHGLGHRIIHQLATSSAGQLSIRVLPGNGTVFSLKWPIPSTEPVPAQLEGHTHC